MDQNVVFKTATVGGFEKRAVLDYIYKMNEDIEKERAELLEEIEDLKKLDNSSEESTQTIHNNMRTLERDLASLSNELSLEKNRRLDLEKEREQLKISIEEQIKEIEKLKIEKTSYVDSEKYRELEAQKEEIEKASYQVGRVMIDARADADNIVEGAQEQASKILEQAELEINALRSGAKQEADTLVSSAQEHAKTEYYRINLEKEKIIGEATDIASARTLAAEKESEKVMAEIQERISEIVSTSQSVSSKTVSQLDQLQKESEVINKVLEDSFDALKEKSNEIGKTIIKAKEKIDIEQENINQIKLLDIANLSADDLMKNKNLANDPVEADKIELNPDNILPESEPIVINDFIFDSRELTKNLYEDDTNATSDVGVETTLLESSLIVDNNNEKLVIN